MKSREVNIMNRYNLTGPVSQAIGSAYSMAETGYVTGALQDMKAKQESIKSLQTHQALIDQQKKDLVARKAKLDKAGSMNYDEDPQFQAYKKSAADLSQSEESFRKEQQAAVAKGYMDKKDLKRSFTGKKAIADIITKEKQAAFAKEILKK
jgi:vacuolar-type H+-ATPase subunit I/STV1